MRERIPASLVAVIGIAGVVTVLIAVLSIGEGFRAVLDLSGAEDVAIVLRNGATDEMSSRLSQEQTRIIADAPQIARQVGKPIASSEFYVVVDVPLRSTGTSANAPLRGVSPAGSELRKGFRIVAGRAFEPGKLEVIVGAGAAQQFAGLDVDKRLRWGTVEWLVTGIFEDRGSVAESEIWTDAAVLQGAYSRQNFQSMRVRLSSASAMRAFKDELTTDPRVNVRVLSEKSYYEEQSRSLKGMVRIVGAAIGVLMGLGAVFAALSTMYAAVSARTSEIATLRALGFGATPIVVSVMTEAILLALIGALVGMVISYFSFNGMRASTVNSATFSQVSFAFAVTPGLLVQALIYGLTLGSISGLFPGLRAARLPIIAGLRDA
jgi:putative ABC transport system permease protein